MKKIVTLTLLTALAWMSPSTTHAFCGFYVGSDRTSLYNDKTMVVLMREGTRTVLSMQNNYQGPPERFAMIVPVPEILSEENVRTLPRQVFERIHTLASPRLVEYWERDPCWRPPVSSARFGEDRRRGRSAQRSSASMLGGAERMSPRDLGVTVEAEFEVAEYDIVILSAERSTGLDTYLRQEGYHIPQGAERALRPYVEHGTNFFVARVDPTRVSFEDGRAMLSPLRFHYDSETFSLPVRLGLINSRGTQDLLVHILARNQRYEVANYRNVLIPTNIPVRGRVLREYGSFYNALFDETMAANPGAVVTEYAWQSNSCDPCPGPVVTAGDIMTLGGNVVAGAGNTRGYTLTRLHYRYGRNGIDEDLVFRPADAIQGGTGEPNRGGMLRRRIEHQTSVNMFQGRYAVMHRWRGEIECAHPIRGRWNGRPRPNPIAHSARPARRGAQLERFLYRPIPELVRRTRSRGDREATLAPALGNTAEESSLAGRRAESPVTVRAAIGACSAAPRGSSGAGLLFALALGAFAWRRHR